MKIEVTQVGRTRRPYRGTVNDVEFVGVAGFCRLVADMATPDDGCIEGIGRPNPRGYHGANAGKWAGNQHALVRAFHEGLDRPPAGLDACHGPCHNRRCINPHHVEFKLPGYNSQDQVRDGTHTAGERNGMAKITDDEKAEIQRLYATGKYLQRELGRQFGISGPRVSEIVNAPTWRVDPMTPERAALIRFLAWSGAYTDQQIAEAVNTTRHQVSDIKRGRLWQPRKQAVQS